jgi:Transglycosylase SLT domain
MRYWNRTTRIFSVAVSAMPMLALAIVGLSGPAMAREHEHGHGHWRSHVLAHREFHAYRHRYAYGHRLHYAVRRHETVEASNQAGMFGNPFPSFTAPNFTAPNFNQPFGTAPNTHARMSRTIYNSVQPAWSRSEGVASQYSEVDGMAAQQASAAGIPVSLVQRVIRRESGGNPRAVSRGNYGLMQIRLGTARAMGYSGSAAGLLDAQTNMTYAVRYLAGAYRAAGGNEGRAVALYARGYYNVAKTHGFSPYVSGVGANTAVYTPVAFQTTEQPQTLTSHYRVRYRRHHAV